MIEDLDFLIDKAVDITIGYFFRYSRYLILHRRADKRIHEKIEKLHDFVTEEAASLLREISQIHRERTSIDENVHKMIRI